MYVVAQASDQGPREVRLTVHSERRGRRSRPGSTDGSSVRAGTRREAVCLWEADSLDAVRLPRRADRDCG